MEAIGGVRYAIVLLGAFAFIRMRPNILKEKFADWTLVEKSVATGMVAAGLVLFALM